MRRLATLLGIGLIAILLSQSGTSSNWSQNATSCGNNIWYGQFLNGKSGLYEYRQLDMSAGYTESMVYGNSYYLIIYVRDNNEDIVGVTIPVNQTFTFGVVEGELRKGN